MQQACETSRLDTSHTEAEDRSSRQVTQPRTLPESAWRSFAHEVWERFPTSMPGATPGGLVNDSDLLRALKLGAEAYLADKPHAQFSVWVAGAKQENLRPFLADERDRSLRSYLERLDSLCDGAEFTVLFANPHLFCDLIADRTRTFLKGLFDVTGVPCGGYDSGIFLGRYGVTPFGVHRGQMSVMTFPVVGRKRFLLWPRGYGEANADIRDAVKFDRHLASAAELSVVNGDVLYWPADYWHVAADAPSFSAALNVGFWWDRPPLTQALLRMSEAIAAEVDSDPRAEGLRDDEGRRAICLHPEKSQLVSRPVATELGQALDVIHRATRGDAIQSALEESWLAFQSGGGVRDARPLSNPGEPFSVEPGMRLRAREPGSVRVAVAADGSLIFAANGHSIRVPYDRAVAAWLEQLAAGAVAAHDPARLGDERARESLQAALDRGVRSRALHRE